VHVEVMDEQQNVGSRVGSPDADRVQVAIDSEGDLSCLVDRVTSDSSVAVVVTTSRCCLWPSLVGRG